MSIVAPPIGLRVRVRPGYVFALENIDEEPFETEGVIVGHISPEKVVVRVRRKGGNPSDIRCAIFGIEPVDVDEHRRLRFEQYGPA